MRKRLYPHLMLSGVAVTLALLVLTPAGASSANISRAYHAATPIATGSLVSLDTAHSGNVIPANIDNATRLLGVAVNSNDSLLAVDPAGGNIQVATSGTVTTLVSTVNGNINVGDEISVSPFDGLGMEAPAGDPVIGLAQTAMTDKTATTTRQVKEKNGKTAPVHVGYIRLTITVGSSNSPTNTVKPPTGLQQFITPIAGHSVATSRIILSLAIAVIALIALIILIYASIYSTIISIGRNPLAKYAVFRTLGSVLLVALLISGVAALTIFALLR